MGKKSSSHEHIARGLREKVERLPQEPGVYLMKDARNEVIYVGKAKDLRARVRTYFQPAGRDIRLICLVAAPEGVAAMGEADSTVPIFTAALDRQLSDIGYILPGLGDAGDRMFGTR